MRVPIQTIHLCTQTGHGVAKRDSVIISPPQPLVFLSLSPRGRWKVTYPPTGCLASAPDHRTHTTIIVVAATTAKRAMYSLFQPASSLTHHPPPSSRYSPLCYAALLSTVSVYTKHVRKAYLCVTAASPWHTSFRPHGRPSNQSCCTKSCGHSFIRLNKSPEHSSNGLKIEMSENLNH